LAVDAPKSFLMLLMKAVIKAAKIATIYAGLEARKIVGNAY
jgi:hypothetical protein